MEAEVEAEGEAEAPPATTTPDPPARSWSPSGAVAAVLFAWHPRLEITVAIGFAYAFCNALARPPLMASLADVAPEVRGSVMGLNGACASVGWLLAAALGGWMLSTIGFVGFGPLTAVLAVVSALLALSNPRSAG